MGSPSEYIFPMEIFYMIFVELMLADPARIFHLMRKKNLTTGLDEVAFYGKATQPVIAYVCRPFRDWVRKKYVLIFASTDNNNNNNNGQPSGGFWFRRGIDLLYIDKAFCAASLRTIRHIDMSNVTQIAVDATLLNLGPRSGEGFASVMDELLACFSNTKNMVFMVPTQPNPPNNRYRGLRLVDEEEDPHQKQLAITNLYHCGAVMMNTTWSTILYTRSPTALSYTLIRTRLRFSDRLNRVLRSGSYFAVILFQRQGMDPPRKNTVTGPHFAQNRALGRISSRSRPAPISMSKLMEYVENAKILTDLH